MYLAQTKQPLYTSKQVQIPEPELYVIYTGDRQERPAEIYFDLSASYKWQADRERRRAEDEW